MTLASRRTNTPSGSCLGGGGVEVDKFLLDPFGLVEVVRERGGGGDVEEAPQDGGFYVRQNGQWINLIVAMGIMDNRDFDGGNFTTGQSSSIDNTVYDGGNFSP